MLLTILWFLIFNWAKMIPCEAMSVCVYNGNAAECPSITNHSVNMLSDISNVSNENVEIYLTSGVHNLTKDLIFTKNVKQTIICGATTSTITCMNASGIIFSDSRNNKDVIISNITFKDCNIPTDVTWNQKTIYEISVTLHFKYAHIKLENVIITGSGIGLFTYQCNKQVIKDCKFENNSLGNAKMKFERKNENVSVTIINTSFINGLSVSDSFNGGGGGLQIRINQVRECNFNITDSKFHSNRALKGSHILVEVNRNSITDDLPPVGIHISNSNFSDAEEYETYGASLRCLEKKDQINVMIENSKFYNNRGGAIEITGVRHVKVINSSIKNNKGSGMSICPLKLTNNDFQVMIFNTTFSNNSRALHIDLGKHGDMKSQLNISHCNFTEHSLSSSRNTEIVSINNFHNIVIENSCFESSHGIDGNCSSLYLHHSRNATLNSVLLQDNNCTGLTLHASSVQIENDVTIAGNSAILGGAINLKSDSISKPFSKFFSRITLSAKATLKIIHNSASRYGGGIFTDETCKNRDPEETCFFQFKANQTLKQVQFSGNRAELGGDVVSGGCLFNCSPVNIMEFIMSEDEQSLSTFAEYPSKVVFCQEENASNNVASCQNSGKCNSSYRMSVYPGQAFKVPLMVVDDCCIPSVGIIEAKTVTDGAYIRTSSKQAEILEEGKKCCNSYEFSIISKKPGNKVMVQLSFRQESRYASSSALLNIDLMPCPMGFKYEMGQCDCSDILKKIFVECESTDHSLKIPPLTWIGNYKESVVVNKFCQHCNNDNENKKTMYINESSTINSSILCKKNRREILCGACAPNYSLQLGGYQCGNCKHSTYQGVLLLILFCIMGIFLIITLLSLNITVSTGVLNALVFYSNMIHSNGNSFLPITSQSKHPKLQNTVKFLSVFQAWMNLDFGIVTCFFDGYDIYISTWMQFLFPLYIWLLILLIVLTSRYSSKVSKLTTSSTVPVLATLLLLSYTKLLITSIGAFSITTLKSLPPENSTSHIVWLLDGNIPYLRGKHIPLFLASILWVVGFLLPFTLLILLGPLVQAKSHYRLLNWINKLKPFLDAFYGPYNSKHRYWPGILLLARLIVFTIDAFYSLGDSSYKLVTIASMITTILIIWIVLTQTYAVQPYQNKSINFLELFYNGNLLIFAIASIYHHTNIFNQQLLASVMVGAAFIVFCGILVYRVFCMVSKFIQFIHSQKVSVKKNDASPDDRQYADNSNVTPTQSTIELPVKADNFVPESNELREPLLTDQ